VEEFELNIKTEQLLISKNKIIGILFLILIIFSLIFSLDQPNSVALGDTILRNIGLKAWSNKTQGYHYTVIYSFVLFIIGYKGAIHFLKDIYPRVTKKLSAVLIIFVILFPSIYSTVNKTIETFSNGINAVDYNRKESNCTFKTDSNGNVVLSANLEFINYSNKDVKFYIKLVPNKFILDKIVSKEPITATNFNANSPKEFILYPKSIQNFQVSFKTAFKNTFKNGLGFQGNTGGLNIIIFTKDKDKQFIKN
jgi:hypothetical protein